MKEFFMFIVILVFFIFMICYIIKKFSSFRKDHGFNRIFKREFMKHKSEIYKL